MVIKVSHNMPFDNASSRDDFKEPEVQPTNSIYSLLVHNKGATFWPAKKFLIKLRNLITDPSKLSLSNYK